MLASRVRALRDLMPSTLHAALQEDFPSAPGQAMHARLCRGAQMPGEAVRIQMRSCAPASIKADTSPEERPLANPLPHAALEQSTRCASHSSARSLHA